jgi:phi LC3 family holin
MKLNWKLRLKNKATLVALVSAVIALVYQVLGIFDIVPGVSEEVAINLVGVVINILVGIGIIVDPTTAGVGDSEQAMSYINPKE